MTGFYPDLAGNGQGQQISISGIADTATVIADSLDSTDFIACFWIITAIDGSDMTSQKFVHGRVNGASAGHIEVRSGNDVKFNIDVQLNSGNIELEITNVNGSSIDVGILRFATERF